MPNKPRHYCGAYPCNERVPAGQTYCDKHKQQYAKAYDRTRGTASERGYDSTWNKVKRMKLKQDPLCEICKANGITKLADLVHHIVPLDEGGGRLDMDNLQSLCIKCHNKIHGWGKK